MTLSDTCRSISHGGIHRASFGWPWQCRRVRWSLTCEQHQLCRPKFSRSHTNTMWVNVKKYLWRWRTFKASATKCVAAWDVPGLTLSSVVHHYWRDSLHHYFVAFYAFDWLRVNTNKFFCLPVPYRIDYIDAPPTNSTSGGVCSVGSLIQIVREFHLCWPFDVLTASHISIYKCNQHNISALNLITFVYFTRNGRPQVLKIWTVCAFGLAVSPMWELSSVTAFATVILSQRRKWSISQQLKG